MNTRKILAWGLSLVTVLTMAACTAKNDSQPPVKSSTTAITTKASEATSEKSTLVYGSHDYTRINPAMDEHSEISQLLFDGLTDHDGKGQVIARLAKSWTVSEDKLTYTFDLQEGVKWHDGQDFTADDVKFTIEAIMNPDNGSENAPNYEEIDKIEVTNPHQVVFKLKEPNAALLDYMTMPIMPKHLLEGENWQESKFFLAPVGTGPYKLTKWEPGQAIIMDKNEAYFAGPAKIQQVVFKIVEDDNAKALQLQSGELTLAQVTPKDAVSFADQKDYVIYDMTTSDYRGVLYNYANEFWQKNADLIPAINYAIDRKAIVDSIILGKGEVAYSPIQRNIYNNKDVEHYDYNPAKAEELLVAAGCSKDGDGYWTRNGKRIGFTINAFHNDQVRIDMAQVIAQQLQAVGLEVKADVPTGGLDWDHQEACIVGWGSPFDADDHTYKIFGTGKGANYSAYSNKLVDQYLTEARQTADPEKRADAYNKFQVELAKNPAYSFVCYIDAIYVAKNNLTGISKDTVLGHHGVGIFWNITDWTLQ